MTIDTGNSKTYINESKNSGDFWRSYYSPTYLTSKENFVFKNKVDLMGNQIKTNKLKKI
jgi:hypothetical protein